MPGSPSTPAGALPGTWRLPGPDSHRLAAVSLSLGYTVTLLSMTTPELLDARVPNIDVEGVELLVCELPTAQG